MKSVSLVISVCFLLMNLSAQTKSLQEKLGYDPAAKLLIVHADDAAVSHSTNQAIMNAFQLGRISSTAIMVPCPWFPEMADFARNNPDYDYGIHLTFSSEWHGYKWGGVAPASDIESLLDEQGYFYASTNEAVKHAHIHEVETELRAQIENALAAGIRPSHFDTHMNTLFGNIGLVKLYIRLGAEYRVPVMVGKAYSALPDSFRIPELKNYISPLMIEAPTEVEPDNWNRYYSEIIARLEPGFSVMILHLASDNEETRAMTKGHDHYNAAWRQRDLDYILSDEFEQALVSNNIQLITWGDIQDLMYPDKETPK